MDIWSLTKLVSGIGGKAFKMRRGHKIAIGVATAVTAAAAGTAIFKAQQAKKQERSVKSLVIEDAAKLLPLAVKKPVDFEKGLEISSKPFVMPESVVKTIGLINLDEFEDTFVLEPKNKTTECVIFYIHGTDFWRNPSRFHYSFFKKLSNKLGARLVLPIYPKAPAHTAVEIQKMLLDRYMYLIEEKHISADKIIFAGDGAGGGIALSLLQKIKYQTLPMPLQAFLFSPWIDITNSNADIDSIQPFDSLLNADALREKGEQYAGDLELTHPAVSPIYGDLTDLCRITVFSGSREIFCADVERLREIADEYELDININIFKNQMYFFVALPIPEAEAVFAIMASEIYGVEECEDENKLFDEPVIEEFEQPAEITEEVEIDINEPEVQEDNENPETEETE